MKRCEQCCGNLWVLESYEIIFNGMETENIDAAIPDRTLVNDSSVQGKMTDNDDTNTLVLQAEGVFVLLFGVKYNLHAIRSQINEPFCYLYLPANLYFWT
jgi:hypothetical protein